MSVYIPGREETDCHGEVVTVTVGCWGIVTACNINTNTDTRKGVYQDGNYRHASFTILTEAPLPCRAERVRLTRHGEYLGEYEILSVEKLPGVGRVRVVV